MKKSQTTTINFIYTAGKTNETNLIDAETGKNILLDKNQILEAAVNQPLLPVKAGLEALPG